MTARVLECTNRPPHLSRSHERRNRPRPRAAGFTLALLSALVLVPLAGAAEPPQGFAVGASSAVIVLFVQLIGGPRAPWGWLGVLVAVAAVVMPGGRLAPLGPGLFVGAC